MHVIARRRLREFWERFPDATAPLSVWYKTLQRSHFATPADVKAKFGSASFLHDSRVVFNIGGNKYRLVVIMLYRAQKVLIEHVVTHEEYDRLEL